MSEASPELTVRLASRLEEIERLAAEIEAFGAAHQLPDAVIFAFNLSLDEIVTNVISYAFTDVQEHPIDVRLCLVGDVLQAEVIDSGRPFNPIDVPAPDLDAPIDERRIGGLGVHIVREMMDSLEYAREGGRNILRLSKRVAGT
jgi:anti-sigma regulatory factor (Ser/Thr protein kinase)